jgi:hypothetical protein
MPIYDLNPIEEPDFATLGDMRSETPTRDSRAYASEFMTGGMRTPGAAIAMTIGGSVLDLVDTAASCRESSGRTSITCS